MLFKLLLLFLWGAQMFKSILIGLSLSLIAATVNAEMRCKFKNNTGTRGWAAEDIRLDISNGQAKLFGKYWIMSSQGGDTKFFINTKLKTDSNKTLPVKYEVILFKNGNAQQTIRVNRRQTYKVNGTCEDLGSTSSVRRSNSDIVATAFRKLSTCDRKYVQQFLRGQELYSGSIDGKWGQNTYKGLVQAGKAGKLKRKTPSEIITVLANNPVCP